jgi:hypothetical protein
MLQEGDVATVIKKLKNQFLKTLLIGGSGLLLFSGTLVQDGKGYRFGIQSGLLVLIVYSTLIIIAIPKIEARIVKEVYLGKSRYKTLADAFFMFALGKIAFAVNFFCMAVLATFLTGSMVLTPLFYFGGVAIAFLYWPKQPQYDAFVERIRQS